MNTAPTPGLPENTDALTLDQLRERIAALPPAEQAPHLRLLLGKQTLDCRQAVLAILRAQKEETVELDSIWERLAAEGDREERSEALEAASALPPQLQLRVLRMFQKDEDAILRRRVLNRMQMVDAEAAVQMSLQSTTDPDEAVRMQATRILIQFFRPELIPALAVLAEDSSPRCRSAALMGLIERARFAALIAAGGLQRKRGARSDPHAMLVFKKFTRDSLPPFLLNGIEETESTGGTLNPENVAELLKRVPPQCIDILAAREKKSEWLREALVLAASDAEAGDDDAIRRLTHFSSDESPRIREIAVRALAVHDKEFPTEALTPLLDSEFADVRKLAAQHLAAAGMRAVKPLRAAIEDSDPGVRRAAYDALAEILSEDEINLWRGAMRDEDESLRNYAFTRLRALPDGRAVREALTLAARSKDDQIRVQAICALLERDAIIASLAGAYKETLSTVLATGQPPLKPEHLALLVNAVSKLYPAGSLEVLIAAARAKSAVVRRAASEALFKKSRKIAFVAAAELIDTDDPDLLKRVALVLGEARDPRGLIPLLRAHDECPGSAKLVQPLLENYREIRSLRFLLSALKMKWASVKRHAARELINLDSPDMIEPLLQATKDPDVDVQRAALQALAKFSKRPEVYNRLIEIRDAKGDETIRQHAVATLLGTDTDSVIGPLIQATKDDDIEVQLAAIQALGKYATRPEVYQRLIEILDYGDIAVREKAVQTLGEYQVKQSVDALIRFLGNPFLKFRVMEALTVIGDRKGYLAVKRFKIREKLYGKNKSKGPIAPPSRKGKRGLASKHSGKK